MKVFKLLFLFLFPLCHAQAQIIPDFVTSLDSSQEENSGLIHVNGQFIGLNDSGDGPFLYEIDTTNGALLRTITVLSASNVDWEAICYDSLYVYVGDFGNNFGSRTNLRIYRMNLQEVLSQDSVQADTISFNYADQTDFTPTFLTTNFDCEGFVSYGDSLYLFTKNWGNQRCNIYPLPKDPGTYTAVRTDSLFTQGVVTDAVYDSQSNSIWLVGYGPAEFVFEIDSVQSGHFSDSPLQRYGFQPSAARQVEAICQLDGVNWLVTAESSNNFPATVYRFRKPVVTSLEEPESEAGARLWPNPAQDWMKVEVPAGEDFVLELMDLHLKTVLHETASPVDVSRLARGYYEATLRSKSVDQHWLIELR